MKLDPRNLLALVPLVVACSEPNDTGSDDSADSESDGADSAGTSGDDATGGAGSDGADPGDDATGGGDDSGGDGDSGDSDGESGGDSDGGTVFIVEPDGGGLGVECDVWNQDCPDGQKCMPWVNDGGNAWNATKCTPVDANPKEPGDECQVEGDGKSGIDDCAPSAMCWNVEDGTGTCLAFCEGSPDAPTCSDPDTACSITNDGVLILCLPLCDPLLQDCQGINEACYPVGDRFQCAPDRSDDTGVYGDPCESINSCDAGLFCTAATNVPGCTGAGCCSEYCDLSSPDGDAQCSGSDMGQTCQSFFAEGEVPPGYEDVGGCGTPQ